MLTEEKLTKLYCDSMGAGAVSEKVNPGVMALISCCEYYEAVLQKAIARGEKWVYTNSNEYAPQATSFDEMVASGRRGANCAMLSNWAFMDIGLMPVGARFWGGVNCDFVRYENIKDYIDAACEVTHYPEGVPFAKLLEVGEVKAGDVFLAKGHTFIYRGDNSFYASGHDTLCHSDPTAPTEDRTHGVFDSFIVPLEKSGNRHCTAYFRIRVKDSFEPKFYRGKDGELREL